MLAVHDTFRTVTLLYQACRSDVNASDSWWVTVRRTWNAAKWMEMSVNGGGKKEKKKHSACDFDNSMD